MLGHKSILRRFVSFLILVLFLLVLSAPVDGQTANVSAVATNTAVVKEEPARSPVNQPSSPDAVSERASAARDSAALEEKSLGIKSDPPRTQGRHGDGEWLASAQARKAAATARAAGKRGRLSQHHFYEFCTEEQFYQHQSGSAHRHN